MNVDDVDYDDNNDEDDVDYDDHDKPEWHFRISNTVAPTNKWIGSFLSSRERVR